SASGGNRKGVSRLEGDPVWRRRRHEVGLRRDLATARAGQPGARPRRGSGRPGRVAGGRRQGYSPRQADLSRGGGRSSGQRADSRRLASNQERRLIYSRSANKRPRRGKASQQ